MSAQDCGPGVDQETKDRITINTLRSALSESQARVADSRIYAQKLADRVKVLEDVLRNMFPDGVPDAYKGGLLDKALSSPAQERTNL